jgi:hypothetical protein
MRLSSRSDPTGALLLGVGGGLVMFYRGFRKFREYKVVADTPRIPIRSVPMGLVHVRGKAQSSELVTSPVTRTPCCFYKVVVEQWKSSTDSAQWEHHSTDRDGIRFYLEDETGKILIDSYSAEYDVPEAAVRIVDGAKAAPPTTPDSGAPDLELLQYVEKAGAHAWLQKGEHWLETKGAQSDPRKEAARQRGLQMLQAGLAFMRDGKLPVDLILRQLEAQPALPDPEHERLRQAAIQHIRDTGTLPVEMPAPHAASGRYRLHEYLILPGQEYFVTGTCIENPKPKDVHDRNMIEQGSNETTFLVSAQPEQQAETSMRGSAIKMVLGGAALTLGCLAFLLLHLKMF